MRRLDATGGRAGWAELAAGRGRTNSRSCTPSAPVNAGCRLARAVGRECRIPTRRTAAIGKRRWGRETGEPRRGCKEIEVTVTEQRHAIERRQGRGCKLSSRPDLSNPVESSRASPNLLNKGLGGEGGDGPSPKPSSHLLLDATSSSCRSSHASVPATNSKAALGRRPQQVHSAAAVISGRPASSRSLCACETTARPDPAAKWGTREQRLSPAGSRRESSSGGAHLSSGQRAAGRGGTLLDVLRPAAAPMAELGQGCGEGPRYCAAPSQFSPSLFVTATSL